jgi:hypothetical protein
VALMQVTHAAIRGALAGLALGAAEYVIVLRLIGRALSREAGQGGSPDGIEAVRRRLQKIRYALLGSGFVVLPALGFLLGSTLGPEMGSVR